MSKDETTRETIDERQAGHLKDAEDAYFAGDDESAKAALDHWKTGEELRSARRGRLSRYGPLVVIGAAVAVTLLSASIPVKRTLITVNATVTGLTFEIGDTYEWQGPAAVASTYISGVDALDWTDGPRSAHDVEATGADVRIERMNLYPSTILEVDAPGEAVQFYVPAGSVHVALSVRRGTVRAAGHAVEYERPVDRPRVGVAVTAAPTAAGAPFSLVAGTPEHLELSRLNVTRVRFVEETAPNSGDYQPAIRSGRVELSDVGRSIDLSPTTSMTVKLAGMGKLTIRPADNAFQVSFVGRADELAVGPDGYERGRMPSLLETVARSERIAFLWAAVAFLSGLGWSVWRWFA